jgi:predicted transcriptional regulator
MSKEVIIAARIRTTDKDKLKKLADNQDVPMSHLVRVAIRAYIEAEEMQALLKEG